jgi:hypothetical protein
MFGRYQMSKKIDNFIKELNNLKAKFPEHSKEIEQVEKQVKKQAGK